VSIKQLQRLVGLLLFGLLCAGHAQAQATRTWISGVGDDANPCSRTAPCKTFAGAISKTVNMPEEATVEEVEQLFIESWKLGLKAVAIYRELGASAVEARLSDLPPPRAAELDAAEKRERAAARAAARAARRKP